MPLIRGGGTTAADQDWWVLHRGSTAQAAKALQLGRAGPLWYGLCLVERMATHRRAWARTP